MSGNQALNINPTVADIDIGVGASSFLFAICALMGASAIALLVMGYRKPVGNRAFHHLAAAICFTASIAYFAMASDLGSVAVQIEYIRPGLLGQQFVDAGILHPTRSVWWARYTDWVVTTPLLLLELLLSTGLPLSEIFQTIFLDEVMIITGLIGALVASTYKWGFFAFGCAAEFYIWWILLFPGRQSAYRLGADWGKAYVVSAVVLSGLWLLYPVAWGLGEGANVISPTGEMVFYGVLDLLAKPVFCFVHVYAVSGCDYSRLGFNSGKYSEGATAEEHAYNAGVAAAHHGMEKSAHTNGHSEAATAVNTQA